MKGVKQIPKLVNVIIIFTLISLIGKAQSPLSHETLDKKVKTFFENHPRKLADGNVPEEDGQLLYNLILENNYKKALEIGTSTGYSTIWIAWALSKTGGKVITIEIDEERHKEALKNFKEAGVEKYIDARLADAHTMIPKLKGPFDFVFSDADKAWYKNYFLAVNPKLKLNGCYATHNVSEFGGYGSNIEYLKFLKQLPNYETIVNSDGAGMAISFKIARK